MQRNCIRDNIGGVLTTFLKPYDASIEVSTGTALPAFKGLTMKAVPKEVISPLIAQIPLHRLGQPEDIAYAILFLSSESYITGVLLRVDGLARV